MGELALYEKTRLSLGRGIVSLEARLRGLDLSADGSSFEAQKIERAADSALTVIKERHGLEAAPHKRALSEVDARWKPLKDGFGAVWSRARAFVAASLKRQQEETERKRREAEENLKEAREKESKAAAVRTYFGGTDEHKESHHSALKDLRAARAAVDALPPIGAPVGIKSDAGTMSLVDNWKWEVVDVRAVPDLYVQRLVDPKKVDLAVKNGLRDIPGLRIFNDPFVRGTRGRTK